MCNRTSEVWSFAPPPNDGINQTRLDSIVWPGTGQVRRHADGGAAAMQRIDRRAGGDPAHHRHGDRTAAGALGADAAGTDPAEGAVDDAGREAAAAVAAAGGRKLR